MLSKWIMKNKSAKTILFFLCRSLLKVVKFSFILFAELLVATKTEEHTPTTEELLCGERVLPSDKYDYPDQKFKNN